MKSFFEKHFPKMKVEDEALLGRRGFPWAIECLIFLLVFLVMQVGEMIPVTFATIVTMIGNPTWLEGLFDAAQQFSVGEISFAEYMDTAMGFTGELLSKIMLPFLYSTLVGTVVVLLYCRFLEKRPLKSMGFHKKGMWKEYGIGLAIGTGMITAAVAIDLLFSGVTVHLSEEISVGMIVAFFFGFVLQGMSEEVLCRGYFMVSLTRRTGKVWAVIISSLAFALLHIANDGVTILALFNIFLVGVVLALWFWKRGNIWGAAAIHTAWNFVLSNVFGDEVSGMNLKTSVFVIESSSGFGEEAELSTTLVMLVVIAVIVFLLPTKKEELAEKAEEAAITEG